MPNVKYLIKGISVSDLKTTPPEFRIKVSEEIPTWLHVDCQLIEFRYIDVPEGLLCMSVSDCHESDIHNARVELLIAMNDLLRVNGLHLNTLGKESGFLKDMAPLHYGDDYFLVPSLDDLAAVVYLRHRSPHNCAIEVKPAISQQPEKPFIMGYRFIPFINHFTTYTVDDFVAQLNLKKAVIDSNIAMLEKINEK